MKRLPLLAVLLAVLPTADAAELTGKEVFNHYCVHCHAPGREHPGTLQLGLTRGAERAVLEERTDLAPEYVRYIVRHGLKAMPAFVPSELDEAQLNALAGYLGKAAQ